MARQVFSYHEPTSEWVLEFTYPSLAGTHADGLEVVEDSNSGVSYLYVTDMSSDFIAQYHKGSDGTWEQTNLFQYNRGTGDAVEGMGFGALGHFWMSSTTAHMDPESASCVFEVGGR